MIDEEHKHTHRFMLERISQLRDDLNHHKDGAYAEIAKIARQTEKRLDVMQARNNGIIITLLVISSFFLSKNISLNGLANLFN